MLMKQLYLKREKKEHNKINNNFYFIIKLYRKPLTFKLSEKNSVLLNYNLFKIIPLLFVWFDFSNKFFILNKNNTKLVTKITFFLNSILFILERINETGLNFWSFSGYRLLNKSSKFCRLINSIIRVGLKIKTI